jgi:hypothetical protein
MEKKLAYIALLAFIPVVALACDGVGQNGFPRNDIREDELYRDEWRIEIEENNIRNYESI